MEQTLFSSSIGNLIQDEDHIVTKCKCNYVHRISIPTSSDGIVTLSAKSRIKNTFPIARRGLAVLYARTQACLCKFRGACVRLANCGKQIFGSGMRSSSNMIDEKGLIDALRCWREMETEHQVKNPPTKTMVIVHGMVVIKDRSGTVKIPAKRPRVDNATLLDNTYSALLRWIQVRVRTYLVVRNKLGAL
ncbi:hypothetical protein BDR06DRAFT_978195 [Suillus hirtellus]|nr:hypothetical protein BDR06DRAFT_978195 [Suillus hirtellus]